MSEDLEAMKKLKSKYEDILLGMKGVTGVGIDGSIIVYVDRLTPELQQVIPKKIEGVDVKVIESKFRLLSMQIMDSLYSDRVQRYRPVPGGVSIGHPYTTAGTLACRVKDKNTGKIIGGLSNNHVCAMQWGEFQKGNIGDPILQPGPYDNGAYPDDMIGTLTKYIPVKTDEDNLVDAAIFESATLKDEVIDIGKPSHSIEPKEGMNVVKSGRTSGITYGRILDCNATLKIDGGEGWGECIFKDQIVIQPAILSPGDSGSWIGEVDTYNTVGIGFAGSETLSVANKATVIEELFDVTIEPPLPKVSMAYVGSFWIGLLGTGFSFINLLGGSKT